MHPIRIGIGGWTYAPWRKTFFPPGLPHDQELAYASTRLTSIEINGTFYRHQSPETFAAWRDATPKDFVFAVKAHRATTHSGDLAATLSAMERFLNSGIAELGPKLGPILWQFAPFRKFDTSFLEPFLAALPVQLDGLRLMHAVEARHPSFEDPAWFALARAYNVAVATIDSDKQALRHDITADFCYARLQRNTDLAPEGYDSAALDDWAARFRGCEMLCFGYFIGGDKQRAPDAACAMLERIGSK